MSSSNGQPPAQHEGPGSRALTFLLALGSALGVIVLARWALSALAVRGP